MASDTAAGQFYEDHERDMADPEYAEAFRDATADPTTTAASYLCGDCGHTDRGPVAELLTRMTAHWRSHRD